MLLAVSEMTRLVDDAFLWIGGICLLFLLGITVAMVAFVLRYHRKRNPKAGTSTGNTPLEVTWIVIPTLLVIFMFWKGYEGFRFLRDVPEDAMTVRVEAQSWFWTFIYPEHGITSDRLFVPVDRAVKLELTSAPGDVVHSLYLPAFRIKEDCVPGRENHLWFRADEEGTYRIFCAEFCGKDHSKMLSELVVLSQKAYDDWVREKVAEQHQPVDLAKAMDASSPEIRRRDGAKLYATYCVSCHGAEGQGGLVTGARDFRKLEGWKRSPKLSDVFRTITLGLDGTQMRPFANLTPWDRFALAHQVASFYKGEDRPRPSAEELQALNEEFALDKAPVERKTIPVEKAMDLIAREAAARRGKE